MKTFIATIALAFTLGAAATVDNTVAPSKTGKSVNPQQRMEETQMRTKNHSDGSTESLERTTTKETPMLNESLNKDETSTSKKKNKRIVR
jgi:hypothetical protein